ncbi:ankyrin repeat-containing domain protein [Chlamydoabsidia padenii]|nr:ankyrin repeat-containing domain protein [Chlamydoabsidia padenii]
MNEHTFSSSSSPISSSINILSDVSAIKDFYAAVNKIEERDLKRPIHLAMENILLPWTKRQDDLVRSLNQLEQSYAMLLKETQTQSTMCHKAIQELHYYKTKYQEFTPSNQELCSTSFSQYNSRSPYASMERSGSASYSPALSNDTILSHHLIPAAKPPPLDLPLPPVPSIEPTERKCSLTKTGVSSQTPPHELSSEGLTFACGDGFWNTIARGKSNKKEVDDLVKKYLERGGKANVANNSGDIKLVKEGYGLIHALIVIRNTMALQRIIEAGANPNVLPLSNHDDNMISPLVLAAKMGYMNGVRLLIERAHANALSSKGPRQENALLVAIRANAYDVVIDTHSTFFFLSPSTGATPLHYACTSGKRQMITFLVRDCGQLTDVMDDKGETPLHYAIRNKRGRAVVELVGELGANPNPYIVKKIPTPLDMAKQGGLRSIEDYLRKMGAKTVKEMEKNVSVESRYSIHSTHTSISHTSASSSSSSIDP